jgi:hypothetical protein
MQGCDQHLGEQHRQLRRVAGAVRSEAVRHARLRGMHAGLRAHMAPCGCQKERKKDLIRATECGCQLTPQSRPLSDIPTPPTQCAASLRPMAVSAPRTPLARSDTCARQPSDGACDWAHLPAAARLKASGRDTSSGSVVPMPALSVPPQHTNSRHSA